MIIFLTLPALGTSALGTSALGASALRTSALGTSTVMMVVMVMVRWWPMVMVMMAGARWRRTVMMVMMTGARWRRTVMMVMMMVFGSSPFAVIWTPLVALTPWTAAFG